MVGFCGVYILKQILPLNPTVLSSIATSRDGTKLSGLSASYAKQHFEFLHLSYSHFVSGQMAVGSHVTSSVTVRNVFG